MPLELSDKRKRIDKAGKAYAEYKPRLMSNLILTRAEKMNQLRIFLDAHIGVFDDYYREVAGLRRDLKRGEKRSEEAYYMAKDIAALFRQTPTGAYVSTHPEGGIPDMTAYLDQRLLQLTNPNAEARRKDAQTSYMTQATQGFLRHERRTSLDFSEKDREDASKAAAQNYVLGQNPAGGLTAAQLDGVRNISAFLFRNTLYSLSGSRRGHRADFVSWIISRPPRELLVLYYLIENDLVSTRINYPQTRLQLQTYTPDLDKFKPRMFSGRLKGFFGRARGENLLWDKLTNASTRIRLIRDEAGPEFFMPIPGAAAPAADASGGAKIGRASCRERV